MAQVALVQVILLALHLLKVMLAVQVMVEEALMAAVAAVVLPQLAVVVMVRQVAQVVRVRLPQ
jgi:hypothetical protein